MKRHNTLHNVLQLARHYIKVFEKLKKKIHDNGGKRFLRLADVGGDGTNITGLS